MTGVASPKPPIKEEEGPKTNDKPTEKCGWGPGCPFCRSQEEKEQQNKVQQQKMPSNPKLQKLQARRPKTLNLNMTKAKQQWEAEMERIIQNTTSIVSQIQSWTQNQMRESGIAINVVMRHSYKTEEIFVNLSN